MKARTQLEVLADGGLAMSADRMNETDMHVERLKNRLQHLIDSPIGNRCVSCGHADGSHNSLGYCQVRSRSSECTCEVGTSIASTASIILRDLPDLLASVAGRPVPEGDDRG